MKEIYNLIPVMKFMITIILLSHMGLDNDIIESIIVKDDEELDMALNKLLDNHTTSY